MKIILKIYETSKQFLNNIILLVFLLFLFCHLWWAIEFEIKKSNFLCLIFLILYQLDCYEEKEEENIFWSFFKEIEINMS